MSKDGLDVELVREQRHEAQHFAISAPGSAKLHSWVKRRLEDGAAISRVAEEFRAMRHAEQWPDAPPAPPASPPTESATPPQVYAKRLYGALATMNEAQATAVLQEVETTLPQSRAAMRGASVSRESPKA